jgi:hypothetical protein
MSGVLYLIVNHHHPLHFCSCSRIEANFEAEPQFYPSTIAFIQSLRNAPLNLPHCSVTVPGSQQAMASIDRAHRMLTNPAIQNRTIPASAEAIATGTFGPILRNLKEHGFITSHMILHDFQWLFPKSEATQQQLSIFLALRDFPLIVPNGDLGRILELELSTATSPPTPPGTHFYLHSFELTRYQLEKVMESMTEQANLLSETVQWENTLIIHNNQAQPCTFTIRYVGKVSGPGRPIDRQIKDLATDKRHSGVLLEFVASVEQLFPDVAAAAQVHLIKQASIDNGFMADSIAEETYRVLIEFFDPRSLLNRIHGGRYVRFVSSQDDTTLFENLQTRYYSRFMAEARHIATDPQMTIALAEHFEEVQNFANSYPPHTGTAEYPFTDGVREAARMSGEPMLYCGTTILLLLGHDISYQQYLGETTFLGGDAWSNHLVRDFLSDIAITEECNANMGTTWDPRAFHLRHAAFITLWPWLWHSLTTLHVAIHFAHQYLSIIRPLVVATFGHETTSILRANFGHENAVPFKSGLSSIVGDITIQYYGLEGDEDSAFLAVPHIDPGFSKYVDLNLSQAMLKFMDLTWHITVHLADEARKLLDQDHANGITRSRKAQCVEILRRVNYLRVSDPNMRAFMDNFREAGNELRSEWKRLHHCPKFRDYRPISDEDGQTSGSDNDEDDESDEY